MYSSPRSSLCVINFQLSQISHNYIYVYLLLLLLLCKPVDTTIREVYNINPPPLSATIAAIIYMYVEPPYRNLAVGSLALQVISAIQSVQAIDFTILVASGDERLVDWYELNGYTKAPLLQGVMGSPDGEFGVTMIAPVGVREGFFEECNLMWWW